MLCSQPYKFFTNTLGADVDAPPEFWTSRTSVGRDPGTSVVGGLRRELQQDDHVRFVDGYVENTSEEDRSRYIRGSQYDAMQSDYKMRALYELGPFYLESRSTGPSPPGAPDTVMAYSMEEKNKLRAFTRAEAELVSHAVFVEFNPDGTLNIGRDSPVEGRGLMLYVRKLLQDPDADTKVIQLSRERTGVRLSMLGQMFWCSTALLDAMSSMGGLGSNMTNLAPDCMYSEGFPASLQPSQTDVVANMTVELYHSALSSGSLETPYYTDVAGEYFFSDYARKSPLAQTGNLVFAMRTYDDGLNATNRALSMKRLVKTGNGLYLDRWFDVMSGVANLDENADEIFEDADTMTSPEQFVVAPARVLLDHNILVRGGFFIRGFLQQDLLHTRAQLGVYPPVVPVYLSRVPIVAYDDNRIRRESDAYYNAKLMTDETRNMGLPHNAYFTRFPKWTIGGYALYHFLGTWKGEEDIDYNAINVKLFQIDTPLHVPYLSKSVMATEAKLVSCYMEVLDEGGLVDMQETEEFMDTERPFNRFEQYMAPPPIRSSNSIYYTTISNHYFRQQALAKALTIGGLDILFGSIKAPVLDWFGGTGADEIEKKNVEDVAKWFWFPKSIYDAFSYEVGDRPPIHLNQWPRRATGRRKPYDPGTPLLPQDYDSAPMVAHPSSDDIINEAAGNDRSNLGDEMMNGPGPEEEEEEFTTLWSPNVQEWRQEILRMLVRQAVNVSIATYVHSLANEYRERGHIDAVEPIHGYTGLVDPTDPVHPVYEGLIGDASGYDAGGSEWGERSGVTSSGPEVTRFGLAVGAGYNLLTSLMVDKEHDKYKKHPHSGLNLLANDLVLFTNRKILRTKMMREELHVYMFWLMQVRLDQMRFSSRYMTGATQTSRMQEVEESILSEHPRYYDSVSGRPVYYTSTERAVLVSRGEGAESSKLDRHYKELLDAVISGCYTNTGESLEFDEWVYCIQKFWGNSTYPEHHETLSGGTDHYLSDEKTRHLLSKELQTAFEAVSAVATRGRQEMDADLEMEEDESNPGQDEYFRKLNGIPDPIDPVVLLINRSLEEDHSDPPMSIDEMIARRESRGRVANMVLTAIRLVIFDVLAGGLEKVVTGDIGFDNEALREMTKLTLYGPVNLSVATGGMHNPGYLGSGARFSHAVSSTNHPRLTSIVDVLNESSFAEFVTHNIEEALVVNYTDVRERLSRAISAGADYVETRYLANLVDRDEEVQARNYITTIDGILFLYGAEGVRDMITELLELDPTDREHRDALVACNDLINERLFARERRPEPYHVTYPSRDASVDETVGKHPAMAASLQDPNDRELVLACRNHPDMHAIYDRRFMDWGVWGGDFSRIWYMMHRYHCVSGGVTKNTVRIDGNRGTVAHTIPTLAQTSLATAWITQAMAKPLVDTMSRITDSAHIYCKTNGVKSGRKMTQTWDLGKRNKFVASFRFTAPGHTKVVLLLWEVNGREVKVELLKTSNAVQMPGGPTEVHRLVHGVYGISSGTESLASVIKEPTSASWYEARLTLSKTLRNRTDPVVSFSGSDSNKRMTVSCSARFFYDTAACFESPLVGLEYLGNQSDSMTVEILKKNIDEPSFDIASGIVLYPVSSSPAVSRMEAEKMTNARGLKPDYRFQDYKDSSDYYKDSGMENTVYHKDFVSSTTDPRFYPTMYYEGNPADENSRLEWIHSQMVVSRIQERIQGQDPGVQLDIDGILARSRPTGNEHNYRKKMRDLAGAVYVHV